MTADERSLACACVPPHRPLAVAAQKQKFLHPAGRKADPVTFFAQWQVDKNAREPILSSGQKILCVFLLGLLPSLGGVSPGTFCPFSWAPA